MLNWIKSEINSENAQIWPKLSKSTWNHAYGSTLIYLENNLTQSIDALKINELAPDFRQMCSK